MKGRVNQMKWNKIDWKKISEIEKSCEGVSDEFDWDKFSKIMTDNSGMGENDSNFTWENGYKAGLPKEGGRFYLCYIIEDDTLQIGVYDDAQEYDPCFWSFNYEECLHPDYWMKIEKPE